MEQIYCQIQCISCHWQLAVHVHSFMLFSSDGLFQLLMEIATNSGPDFVRDGLSLTSLGCSALISLVVALGDTGKLMTALSAMLMGTGPLSTQKIQVV